MENPKIHHHNFDLKKKKNNNNHHYRATGPSNNPHQH